MHEIKYLLCDLLNIFYLFFYFTIHVQDRIFIKRRKIHHPYPNKRAKKVYSHPPKKEKKKDHIISITQESFHSVVENEGRSPRSCKICAFFFLFD